MRFMREAFSYPNYSGESNLGPFLGLTIVLLVLPIFLSSYMETIMARFLIYAIFAMSYNVAFGYAGLLSLGHAAFFGTGGYVVGLLTLHGVTDLFWINFPLGIVAAAVVAAIVLLAIWAKDGFSPLWLVLSIGLFIDGVVVYLLLEALAELLRISKKRAGLPFSGVIS